MPPDVLFTHAYIHTHTHTPVYVFTHSRASLRTQTTPTLSFTTLVRYYTDYVSVFFANNNATLCDWCIRLLHVYHCGCPNDVEEGLDRRVHSLCHQPLPRYFGKCIVRVATHDGLGIGIYQVTQYVLYGMHALPDQHNNTNACPFKTSPCVC